MTNKKNLSQKREAKILIKSIQLSRVDSMRKLKVTAILHLVPMAVKMMAKSLELNPAGNKWLYAAAVDRDLMRRNKPQIYGSIKLVDELRIRK